MQCRRCGKDLGSSMRCAACGYENTEGNVREMTNTEKTFFNGVTIDANGENEQSEYQNRQRSYNYGTRRTYVSFGGSNIFTRAIGSFIRALFGGNRLAQVAAVLIGFALAALMFFVALPIIFITLAIGIGLLVLAKLSR